MKFSALVALVGGASLALMACSSEPNSGDTTSSSSSSSSSTSGGNAALTVESHKSPDGFVVNSHLIKGEKEAVLVDGQFFSAEAQKVVDMVKASGKTLTTVFMTHAHPDHYIGMDVIHTAFPDAKYVTTAAVLADYDAKKDGTLAYLQMNFPGQVPDKLVTFTALAGNSITLENHTLEVVEIPNAGESGVAAGLQLGDTKAFIAGDLIYNKAFLWTAECKLDGWAQNLDFIAAKGYETFYPGHGDMATSAVITDDKTYLTDVKPILDSAATPDEAMTQIKAKYPDWMGDGLLSFSTGTYFMSCKMP